MANQAKKIMEGAISIFLVATVVTLALQSLFSASMPSVPATVIALVTTLIGTVFAVGLAYSYYKLFVGGGGD